MKRDWRKPFLELKTGLRPLYDANLSIHHSVLLSTNRTREELQSVVEMLEPAYCGKKLAKVIEVNTSGCTYHSHLFFADDRRGIERLGQLLYGIETWMDETPPGFLPSFTIPRTGTQTDQNLIRWISTIYHLAWASDAPFPDIEIEYEEDIDSIGFFPWVECPQPPGCRPLEWLTHRRSGSGELLKIKQRFEERLERFPDVVDAYLTQELIASSLAAIDILAYVMHGERKEKPLDQDDIFTELAKKKLGRSKKTKDVENLERLLLYHHNPWENRNKDVDPKQPLEWRQIAEKMGWEGSHTTVQSRVDRSMRKIFGSNPLTMYKKALENGIDRSDRPEGSSFLHFAISDPDRRSQRR